MPLQPLRRSRLLSVLDGEDPQYGRLPALVVSGLIVFSACVISIETIPDLPQRLRSVLGLLEIGLLALFIVEYALRLAVAPNRLRYALSFWGIIDFLACVPALLFLFPELQTVRLFRLLRLVRILKLFRASRALDRLARAYYDVRGELAVFTFITAVVMFLAAVGIYHLEHEAQPDVFGSIPQSLWWAVATLTTVGYGDAYPVTSGGQMFTGLVLLVGLGVVAVPAGLITASLLESDLRKSRRAQDHSQPSDPQ